MGITAQIRRLAGSCVAATARGFVSSYENTERFFFQKAGSIGPLLPSRNLFDLKLVRAVSFSDR